VRVAKRLTASKKRTAFPPGPGICADFFVRDDLTPAGNRYNDILINAI
jgi:hypothetical protein